MHLLVTVEMHRPGKEGAGLVLRQLLLHQQRIGAEIDKFLPRDDAAHDFGELLVQQRLTAGDRNDRRAAFVDGVQRVFNRHILVQNGVWVVDLAATGASQVTPEQRLQHQHQRVSLLAGQALTDDVTTDE